jgi:hypothetical protein
MFFPILSIGAVACWYLVLQPLPWHFHHLHRRRLEANIGELEKQAEK